MHITKKLTLTALLLGIGTTANALLPTPSQSTPEPIKIINSAPPPLLVQPAVPALPTNEALSRAVYAFLVKTDENGDETLVPIQAGMAVKSGDTLEYQAHFTNYTGERIRRTSVSLSIPMGVELVGGITPVQVAGSVDGSRFARMPLRANIGGEIQNMPYRYYKALRWQIEDIGIHGTAVVKYRAVLR